MESLDQDTYLMCGKWRGKEGGRAGGGGGGPKRMSSFCSRGLNVEV